MVSSRELGDHLAAKWEREAADLERGADRADADYDASERKVLRARALALRACASELRTEARKITRG